MTAITELERRLAKDPTDADTALVYADALTAAGDLRGELIVIQHELATDETPADLARTEKLVHRVAQLVDDNPAWLGKPGGYPFQRRWRPYRKYVRYGMGYAPGISNLGKLRGAAGLALFRRVRGFVEQLTTSAGPVMVNLAGVPTKMWRGAPGGPPGLLDVLGADTLRGTIWSGPEPSEPIHAALEDFLSRLELATSSPAAVTLRYDFLLAYPGSSVPLPYQTGEFYPSGDWLGSSLLIDLAERTCNLYLKFPFEDFDAAFQRCHDRIEGALGRCFTRNAWYRVSPDARGESEVVRKASFRSAAD